MNIKSIFCAITVCTIMLVSVSVQAAITAYDIRTVVQASNGTGSCTTSFSDGDTIQGEVVYDIDEAIASFFEGDSKESILKFLGTPDAPYEVMIESLQSLFSLTVDEDIDVEVSNHSENKDVDTNVVGIFDIAEDDHEWSRRIVADGYWFIGTREIPDNLPISYNAVMSEEESDEFASKGEALAIASMESFHTVPVPAAVWLFASGLIALAGLRRKFKKS